MGSDRPSFTSASPGATVPARLRDANVASRLRKTVETATSSSSPAATNPAIRSAPRHLAPSRRRRLVEQCGCGLHDAGVGGAYDVVVTMVVVERLQHVPDGLETGPALLVRVHHRPGPPSRSRRWGGFTFESCGRHELRGFDDSFELFRVIGTD